jgi:transposase
MLVQQRTAHILSFESFFTRVSGKRIKCDEVKGFDIKKLDEIFKTEFEVLAAKANISVIKYLTEKIKEIENVVLTAMKLTPQFQKLLTVRGIGNILALTIALETGYIGRFDNVGNYASYCRCVQSIKKSNGKKKGENNRKNGNKFLAWAFVEAANKAKRYCPYASRFFQRKAAKTNNVVATKALAHKIARLSYHIMNDQSEYDPERAFGRLKKGLRELSGTGVGL